MLWRRSSESPSIRIRPEENRVISSHPNRNANGVEAVTTSTIDNKNRGKSTHSQCRRAPE